MIWIKPSLKAQQIIQELQIRAPSEIDIVDIAMVRGAYVKEQSLHGCEARVVRKGSQGIITYSCSIYEEGRKRFAIAHELGHFELHNTSQMILCSEEDMFVWKDDISQELEANEFATEILMPEEIFLKYIKRPEQPNMETVRKLAKEFNTTLTATALRYVQLSLEPCAIVISKDGVIKWYKKSNSFNFHVKVRDKLSKSSYAFDYYDGIDLPDIPKKVPADSWLSGDIDEEAEILENSVALTSYSVILSLLWINEEVRTKYRDNEDPDREPEFDLTNPITPDGKRWRW